MMHVGDIMSTVGGVQSVGGYHPLSTVGGYHDIMSTVGVFSTVGYSNNKRFFPPPY